MASLLNKRPRACILGIVAGSIALSLVGPVALGAIATDGLSREAGLYPLELDLLLPDADLSGRAVVTRDTVEDSQLTLPSLWWAEQQYGGKLLEQWIAHTGEDGKPRRVDLVVDRQLWGLYSYIEQYQFIHQFGVAALQFGYSTRIFTAQGSLLGTYLCALPDEPGAANDALVSEVPSHPETIQPNLDQFICQVDLEAVGIQAPRGPFEF